MDVRYCAMRSSIENSMDRVDPEAAYELVDGTPARSTNRPLAKYSEQSRQAGGNSWWSWLLRTSAVLGWFLGGPELSLANSKNDFEASGSAIVAHTVSRRDCLRSRDYRPLA